MSEREKNTTTVFLRSKDNNKVAAAIIKGHKARRRTPYYPSKVLRNLSFLNKYKSISFTFRYFHEWYQEFRSESPFAFEVFTNAMK